MSNDISYAVKVQDGFSKNIKKFQIGIDGVAKRIDNLNIKLAKVQGMNLNIRGSIFDANSILKPLSQIQQKLKEFSYGTGSTLGKVQRGNQRIIKSNQQLAKSFADVNSSNNSGNNSGNMAVFSDRQPARKEGFTAGLKRRALNFAEYGGLYYGAQSGINTAKNMYENAKKMDSYRASLSVVAPRVKGNEDATSESEIAFLRGVADKLGADFKSIIGPYTRIMATTTLPAKDTKALFESLIGYQSLTGKSADETNQVLFGIEQMLTKGRIQGQEYNLQLQNLSGGKQLFTEALQRATGNKKLTQGDFLKYMDPGEGGISSDILRFIPQILFEQFGKAMEIKSHTIQGEENRLNSAFNELSTTITDIFKPALIGIIVETTSVVKSLQGFVNDIFNSDSVKSLGALWNDMSKTGLQNAPQKFAEAQKNKKSLFPDLDLGNPQSWGEWIGRKMFEADSSVPENSSEAAKIDLNIVFTNAPAGMSMNPMPAKGSIGVTTDWR